MTRITLSDILKDTSGWLSRVKAGESLLVTEGDRPVAEINPVVASARDLRPFGLYKGQFTVPDDFDASLPDDVLDQFEPR